MKIRILAALLCAAALGGCFRPAEPIPVCPDLPEETAAVQPRALPAASGSRLGTEGCSFGFDDGGNLILYWADGHSAVIPDAAEDRLAEEQYAAAYVSDAVSGAAIFDSEKIELCIRTTADRGGTWTEAVISLRDPTPEGAEHRDFWLDIYPYDMWLSYTSPTDGQLMLTTYYGMANGKQILYTTADGGETWRRIYESEWRRYAVGAGFSRKYGFMAMLFADEFLPVLCTRDGGVTWEPYDLMRFMPEKFREEPLGTRYVEECGAYAFEACAPVFDGDYGRWAVRCRTEDGREVLVILESRDGGESWEEKN